MALREGQARGGYNLQKQLTCEYPSQVTSPHCQNQNFGRFPTAVTCGFVAAVLLADVTRR